MCKLTPVVLLAFSAHASLMYHSFSVWPQLNPWALLILMEKVDTYKELEILTQDTHWYRHEIIVHTTELQRRPMRSFLSYESIKLLFIQCWIKNIVQWINTNPNVDDLMAVKTNDWKVIWVETSKKQQHRTARWIQWNCPWWTWNHWDKE